MNSTKKRHSKVLIWLFLTEMWERFSYYGMRAILVLYLVTAISEGGLGWSEMASGQLYGIYTGLVYLTPLIGGYIADKYWGFKSSIIVGGILMALGHGALAINSDYAFFAGLSLLIIGNGFFKPNISSLVGEIYSKNEDLKALKDSAFTIFYMGINLGAFLGTLVCGYLAQAYGWHYGFGAAGIGMIVGLIVFSLTKHHIQEPVKNSSQQQIERAKPLTSIEKDKILVIFILAFFQITFWLAYEQAGSSVNLFTHTYVNKIIELPNIIGSWFIQADAMGKYMFDIPTAWFQAINAFLIIVLGLPFSALWKWLAIKNKNPSSPTKFALGLIFLSIGFMVLIVGATGVAKGHVHWCWLVFMYLLHTVGELCLSPVGLSMVTKMAPVKLAGTMMGVWFLAIAIANYIGGALSGYMQEISKASSISNFFMIFVTIPMVAAVVLLVFSKKLTKLMHDTE
jgi:POT family proton-dependent oligopeptide transporter